MEIENGGIAFIYFCWYPREEASKEEEGEGISRSFVLILTITIEGRRKTRHCGGVVVLVRRHYPFAVSKTKNKFLQLCCDFVFGSLLKL